MGTGRKRWCAVVGSLVAFAGVAAEASANRDPVIAHDDGVVELFALDRHLLYGRYEQVASGDAPPEWLPATARRWMRLVHGRRSPADGLPYAAVPHSIGRDPRGRVVAVVGSTDSERWWVYDIKRDAARDLGVRARRGCTIASAAVWRSRVATVERCRGDQMHVVLHERAGDTTVASRIGGGSPKLVLRRRSLAVVVQFGRFEQTVWRILDRGRRCPKAITGTVEENGIWAGIGTGTLTWAIAGWEFDGLRFAGLQVGAIALTGRCERSPTVSSLSPALPMRTLIHGAYSSSGPAIDGRTLYYATDTTIHRLQLPQA
jgi:hypothetical protein